VRYVLSNCIALLYCVCMYRSMPVEEYGAALLRGMGWSGPDITNNTNTNDNDGTLG
jgi:G-patch domain